MFASASCLRSPAFAGMTNRQSRAEARAGSYQVALRAQYQLDPGGLNQSLQRLIEFECRCSKTQSLPRTFVQTQ
jgi:hypothetical protein